MNWSQYIPYLWGMLFATIAYSLGVWAGKRIAIDAMEAATRAEKARLLLDQAEVKRMSIGRRAGVLDGNGRTIKLYTASALSRLSDDELAGLCASRGLLVDKVLQGKSNRVEMIAAIRLHQSSVMPAWVNLEEK